MTDNVVLGDGDQLFGDLSSFRGVGKTFKRRAPHGPGVGRVMVTVDGKDNA